MLYSVIKEFGNGSMLIRKSNEMRFVAADERAAFDRQMWYEDRDSNSLYYVAYDNDGGHTPLVNTQRYTCDTYLRVYKGIIYDGFVYCHIGYHTINHLIGKKVDETVFTPISRKEYNDARHDFLFD